MKSLKKAANLIKQGEVVAFPTETVYGLGADAGNEEACKKIFAAKGRPSNNPLIVHASSVEKAMQIAEFDDLAIKIAKFWPGPLSMVLPRKKGAKIAPSVAAGLDTIAIRIPAHETAKKLIDASGCYIAAPSANKSGKLSPTTFQHVKNDFGNNIHILESDLQSEFGLESTIVRPLKGKIIILRHGFITKQVLEKETGIEAEYAGGAGNRKVIAPGMLLKHYSPSTKMRINALRAEKNEASLEFGDSNLGTKYSLNLSERGCLAEAAANLFAYLHRLDKSCEENNCHSIAVAKIPDEGIGMAINDRLSRGANSS